MKLRILFTGGICLLDLIEVDMEGGDDERDVILHGQRVVGGHGLVDVMTEKVTVEHPGEDYLATSEGWGDSGGSDTNSRPLVGGEGMCQN